MTFLIAEDSPRMRASIAKMIHTQIPDHHMIYEASDGGEAIRVYNKASPDWVVMDIMMEPMDGLAATRQIIEAHPDAKIVILTNFDDAQYRRAARAAGVRGFFLKEQLNEMVAFLSAA